MSSPQFAACASRHWRPFGLALAGATVALLSACGHKASDEAAAQPVIAATAQAADAAAVAQFPGDVHARYEMPLSFRIGGKLAARHVDIGQLVKRGEKLAELDPNDAASSVASAQAALNAAESRFAFAAQQQRRDEAQDKQNLISKAQLEQTGDAYTAAAAAREQARQQLALAKNQLNYTTLVADHDGVITGLQADVGQVLAAGQAVLGFAWAGEREVQVDVPESRIGEIAVGQPASVTLASLPGQTLAAHVREVAGAADPQARTYLLKLALDAPPPALALGMSANVRLQAASSQRNLARIPATALFHQGDKPAVWVIDATASTLSLRPVRVLRYEENGVLLDDGLKPGERIVAQGVHVVASGEKVAPIAPPHAEDAP